MATASSIARQAELSRGRHMNIGLPVTLLVNSFLHYSHFAYAMM